VGICLASSIQVRGAALATKEELAQREYEVAALQGQVNEHTRRTTGDPRGSDVDGRQPSNVQTDAHVRHITSLEAQLVQQAALLRDERDRNDPRLNTLPVNSDAGAHAPDRQPWVRGAQQTQADVGEPRPRISKPKRRQPAPDTETELPRAVAPRSPPSSSVVVPPSTITPPAVALTAPQPILPSPRHGSLARPPPTSEHRLPPSTIAHGSPQRT
jgi:hypothetical protein